MHTIVRSDFPADFSERPSPDHTLADGPAIIFHSPPRPEFTGRGFLLRDQCASNAEGWTGC